MPVFVVQMSAAGVIELYESAVKLKNGTTLRLGEQFHTGERLISINKAEGKVVTDRRVLILM